MTAVFAFINPPKVEQGTEDQTFTIKGSGFLGSSVVTVSGTGVLVSDLQVTDDQTVIFKLVVASNAAIGLRDVSVTLADATVATFAGVLAVTNFQSLITQLRRLVGERIPPDKEDTDTFFTDDELTDTIMRHAANLYIAAAECWGEKAAERADLHDITESGSERKMSQLFSNATKMRDAYQAAGVNIMATLVEPAIAQTASILGPGLGRPSKANSLPVVDAVFDPVYNDPFLFLNAMRPWPLLDMFFLR